MTRLERTLSWTVLALLALIALVAAFWFWLPGRVPEGGITIRIERGRRAVVMDPVPSVLPDPPGQTTPTAPSQVVPVPSGPASVLPGDTFRGGQPTPAPGRLRVPVAGVRPEQLVDTYTQSRSQGRAHNAIDIPAPRGTPVVAVADGRVLKLFQSDQGGTTLYQLDPDGRTVYYYAHLAGYAPGIREGQVLRSGETLGYVGDTGNAGAGNHHLHFGVSVVANPQQYWGGRDVNPYPLLRGTR